MKYEELIDNFLFGSPEEEISFLNDTNKELRQEAVMISSSC